LTVPSVGPPQLGTITGWYVTTGVAYYTLDQHYASDSFTYVITDGHGGMGLGTVTVNRNTSGNHAPVAVSYSTTVQAGQSITLPLPASDIDSGTTMRYRTTAPLPGNTLSPDTGHETESFRTYTPNAGFTGIDSFTFQADDGLLSSSSTLSSPPATVVIKVETTANNPPLVINPSYQATLNTELQIDLSAWVFDQDGDHLTYSYPNLVTPAGTLKKA